ncbi:hypothetical protein COAQ111491_12375 [Comamonas aquatilis]
MPDKTFALLWRLAQLIEEIVEGGAIRPLLAPQLNEVYSGELARRGWVTHGGYLRLAQLSSAFLEYAAPLGKVAEFARLPIDTDAAAMQLGRLLHPSRTGTHPLSHLLVIHWLFGSASKFREAQSINPQSQKLYSFCFADSWQPVGLDVIAQPGHARSIDLTAVTQACGGVGSETQATTLQGGDAFTVGQDVSPSVLPAIDAAASQKLRRGKGEPRLLCRWVSRWRQSHRLCCPKMMLVPVGTKLKRSKQIGETRSELSGLDCWKLQAFEASLG